ncbi:hypothetical protein JOD54_000554 [Actinokineospora baliensis]|nr:hypothetical protein [Actinokineospora baliensis]
MRALVVGRGLAGVGDSRCDGAVEDDDDIGDVPDEVHTVCHLCGDGG